MVCLWIDREAFPGQPLFNPETEGCLPMSILLADSFDGGRDVDALAGRCRCRPTWVRPA